MSRCRFERTIVYYFDHSLSQKEKSETEKHLKDCSHCRSTLEGLKKMRHAVRCLESVSPPTDLVPRVLENLDQPKQRFRWKLPVGISLKPALAGAFVILLVALFSYRQFFYSPAEQNTNFTADKSDVPTSATIPPSDTLYYMEENTDVREFLLSSALTKVSRTGYSQEDKNVYRNRGFENEFHIRKDAVKSNKVSNVHVIPL